MTELRRRGARCWHYAAFGLHLASDIELPELSPFGVEEPSEVDVVIALEALPDRESGQGLSVGPAGVATLRIDNIASYRVSGGREIAVDPHPDAAPRDVRLYLLGSAFGILCHQRGLLPLHANAIIVNRHAVAFAGPQKIGKSTLAAHFHACGYDVLCDDVCVVSFDASGRPLAWPGLPRLKLWSDAAEAFGYDREDLERAVGGLEKYHVPLQRVARRGPYPLACVYILQDVPRGTDVEMFRLEGMASVNAVLGNVYRAEYLKPMGLLEPGFLAASAVAGHARIFHAPRARGYEVFAAEAERFERHFAPGCEQAAPAAPSEQPERNGACI